MSSPFLILNAGSDDMNFQVHHLASAVKDAIPGTSISINAAAQKDLRSYQVDFGLLKEVAPQALPRFGLQQCVTDLIDGLSATPDLTPDFRDSHYIRLKSLRLLRASNALSEDLRWLPKA